MTAIFVKSVRTATIAIFQFRIRGCIRFVAGAFRSEEEVLWRRNSSLTYFLANCLPPPLDPPLGGVFRKAYKQVHDYEYFISIKFCKHPSSGSVGKAEEEILWRRGSSGGLVVKLLACGARGPGFDSRPRHLNFQRLVISCFQVEIWLKDR